MDDIVRERLGEADDLDVFDRLVAVAGLRLVDAGCGAGGFARALAERGATVVGLEPDPVQAGRNRAAEAPPGVTFVEAPAEAMPLDDDSADGVVFKNSLHHVAPAKMDAALAEALRVIRPGGFLYVAEPLMTGAYSALTKPFNDETEVRRLAYEALMRHAPPRFAAAREVVYTQWVDYPDFDAFLREKLAVSFADHRRDSIDVPEVRARFEAGRRDGGYRFDYHSRADYFCGLDEGG